LRLADGAEKAQYYVNKAKEDGTYHEGMPKEGDKIVVIKEDASITRDYKDGDILTVKRVHDDGTGDVNAEGIDLFLCRQEFEIIERVVSEEVTEKSNVTFGNGDVVYYVDYIWFGNEGFGEVKSVESGDGSILVKS